MSIARRLASGLVVLLLLGGLVVPASAEDHGHGHQGLNALLHGDYAFTGSTSCLVSRGGFNPDLTPVGPPAPFPFMVTFSAQGVRTFNGDGTGHAAGRAVTIGQPFALPTTPPFFHRGDVGTTDFELDFTYDVAPDGTFTVENVSFAGSTDSGQTLTITGFPTLSGFMSQDRRTLTVQHADPAVETVTFFTGNVQTDVQQRVCHRSRVLIKLGR